jgi:hypothetical protein
MMKLKNINLNKTIVYFSFIMFFYSIRNFLMQINKVRFNRILRRKKYTKTNDFSKKKVRLHFQTRGAF